MRWILRGCPVCAGDLHEDVRDEGGLTCFMCARSFPATEAREKWPANGVVKEPVRRTRVIVAERPHVPSLGETPRRAAA